MTKKAIAISVIFCFLIMAPYAYGYLSQDANHVFGGFVANPIDGNSYLAKMQLGYIGEWRFQPLYSPEKTNGAFLFLFYIFLGHIARLLGFSLDLVYHLARLLASICMLISLYSFIGKIFSTDESYRDLAFFLVTFGSGLGWLTSLFGILPVDFWVSEAYPFLSGYAAPHFSLGIALFLYGIQVIITEKPLIALLVTGLLLAIVMPFGLVEIGVLYGLNWGWQFFSHQRVSIKNEFAFLAPGGVFVIYQYLATWQDPVLKLWNQQNITPSPELMNLLLSLSPAMIAAIPGLWICWKQRNSSAHRLLFIWLLSGFVLAYVPFSLQRRFLFAFFIPCALLAVIGLKWAFSKKIHMPMIKTVFLGISVLSNVVILVMGIWSIAARAPILFFTVDESKAFHWLAQNTPVDAVILSSSDTGMYLPARTGRRVIYGHPFESIYAQESENYANQFFVNSDTVANLQKRDIRYIFQGPRESLIGTPEVLKSLQLVYANDTVQIFQIPE